MSKAKRKPKSQSINRWWFIVALIFTNFVIFAFALHLYRTTTPCSQMYTALHRAVEEDIFRSPSGQYLALVTERNTSIGRAYNGISKVQVYDVNNCRYHAISDMAYSHPYEIVWTHNETRLQINAKWTTIGCNPCYFYDIFTGDGSERICSTTGNNPNPLCYHQDE